MRFALGDDGDIRARGETIEFVRIDLRNRGEQIGFNPAMLQKHVAFGRRAIAEHDGVLLL